jgi:hypothetical protein
LWPQKGAAESPRTEPDAAFAKPEIYEALEQRGVKYAIRIPANDSLERDIAELLTRPLGRPSHKPGVWYKGFLYFLYQAASWKTARRVVAKVEARFGGLFSRVGFMVPNLETDSRWRGSTTSGAWRNDQRRQASGDDDAAELPSVPRRKLISGPAGNPERLCIPI